MQGERGIHFSTTRVASGVLNSCSCQHKSTNRLSKGSYFIWQMEVGGDNVVVPRPQSCRII